VIEDSILLCFYGIDLSKVESLPWYEQIWPWIDDGTATLNEQDIASLGGSTKIVLDNLTEDQAMQINGPVGKQEWHQVSHLEIKNNKATGNSVQINDGMSSEAFAMLLQSHQVTLEREKDWN
jgi:DNA phosphorothioation-dependent restriction protein DptG